MERKGKRIRPKKKSIRSDRIADCNAYSDEIHRGTNFLATGCLKMINTPGPCTTHFDDGVEAASEISMNIVGVSRCN